MITTFDRFMFTQIGLDSAALTMLGTVVHTPRVAGEYRGTVRAGGLPEATFYVSVDPQCAVAQVNVDLASLMAPASKSPKTAGDCGCGAGAAGDPPRFVVHPKGYIVFHVGSGGGGFSVNLRRAEEDREHKAYDTRQLQAGDIFAAVVIRPGTYAMKNLVTGAVGELTVAYPVLGKTAFKPPPALHIDCGKTFEPSVVHLLPSQGVNVHILEAAHLKIELLRGDDGPGRSPPGARSGWKKSGLAAGS